MNLKRLVINNKVWFLLFFLFLVTGAFLLLAGSKGDLVIFLNGLHHPVSDMVFRYYTYSGDGIVFVVLAIVLLFVRYRYALLAIVSFAGSGLLAQFFKRAVFGPVPRPSTYFRELSYQLHPVEGVDMASYFSFPSGHSTTAFAMFCLLAFIPETKPWTPVWFFLALTTALSRVYLAQHFLEDIYAGAILGTCSTMLAWGLLNPVLEKKSWAGKALISKKRES